MKEFFGLFVVAFGITALVGWVLNIITFIQALPLFDVLQIARAAGIVFAPLGAILGLFA